MSLRLAIGRGQSLEKALSQRFVQALHFAALQEVRSDHLILDCQSRGLLRLVRRLGGLGHESMKDVVDLVAHISRLLLAIKLGHGN